jgi:class 3 adenylate cyclase
MPDSTTKRKLAAILYADVEGYSRLTSRDELGTHRRVMKVLDYASESIKGSDGTVLRYAGDAILAEFPSIVSAVNVAVSIQSELAERSAEEVEDNRVQIRIGLNLGEVLQDRGEIYGDGVNLAARLESSAEPGGICTAARVVE